MKYWVFDLDGTLVDSHNVYFDSLSAVFKNFGASIAEEDKAEVLRISGSERGNFFAKKLGPDKVEAALQMLEQRFVDDVRKVKVFDGVEDLLENLHSRNTKLALWTARDLASAIEVLNFTGLAAYFSFRVGNTCISKCKPDPEGLLRIAKQFECSTADMYMVGDHDNDINAAKACGAKSIRAQWHNPKSNLLCSISDFQFNRVQTLNDWVTAQPI